MAGIRVTPEQLASMSGRVSSGAAHIEGDDMSHGGQCGPYTRERSSPLTWCRPYGFAERTSRQQRLGIRQCSGAGQE